MGRRKFIWAPSGVDVTGSELKVWDCARASFRYLILRSFVW